MRILWKIFVLSGIVAVTFVAVVFLWSYGFVDLPPVAVYSFHLLEANVSNLRPKPTPTVKLEVKFHKQEHSLSCEAASLKAALSQYGLDIPESKILELLPFDKTPRQKGMWGDPYQGFVGNIDGKMLIDGYGVYNGPIADVGANWRRTEAVDNMSASGLAGHLKAGHPVIVWGYLGRGKKTQWFTPEGKLIKAVNGEHARVAIGFSGPESEPDGFFIMDPIYGEMYWSKEKFIRNWDAFDRMGVVVY